MSLIGFLTFKGYRIPWLTWPMTTFDKKMSLFLGKRRVDLYFSRAHTAGDIVIHVPDSNVLFTGILLNISRLLLW